MSLITNPWLIYLHEYKKKNPTLSHKEAIINAKGSYGKLTAAQKSNLSSKGFMSKPKRMQKGKGAEMDDLMPPGDFDFEGMDFEGMDLNDTMDYAPPIMPTRSARREARDTRFMTRKMMNQLIKLKKKNDKHKLGYTIEQLKDMASKGITI